MIKPEVLVDRYNANIYYLQKEGRNKGTYIGISRKGDIGDECFPDFVVNPERFVKYSYQQFAQLNERAAECLYERKQVRICAVEDRTLYGISRLDLKPSIDIKKNKSWVIERKELRSGDMEISIAAPLTDKKYGQMLKELSVLGRKFVANETGLHNLEWCGPKEEDDGNVWMCISILESKFEEITFKL